ncbi:zinc finger protein PLAG1 [Aspergillus udagawae]|uniref:Zinc finger protein PLAG1 n=1 Tax=Aspergillus udagawae TaxID=91492 RepID=A0A8H3RP96_9EURO|nr:zinc finger protein PLAG1 [Aspergillus udagawae]GFF32789.1 zinc finger protein PLAG1 [Aspergillus udagawae]GFF99520.1 zinc finger protein PLAG1 [Aspergillus udagawae]GFG14855.1 zinc finger protein PLAG1 [Aspergillus udagawae]GFG21523.1 zinc finger protein PLAG1 [Aspergillus udagawae]
MYSHMNDRLYPRFTVNSTYPPSTPMEQSPSPHSAQSFSFADVFPSGGNELELPLSHPFDSVYELSPPSPYNSTSVSDLYALNTTYSVPIPSYSSSYETQFAFTPSLEESLFTQYSLSTSASSSESAKSPKAYACEDCGKAFTRSADLKRHQTSVHYPVYQDCPVEHCPRKDRNGFPRRDHLIEHLRSSHHMDLPKRRMTKRVPKAPA